MHWTRLEGSLNSLSNTCIRITSSGIDCDRVVRTTLSEVEDDFVPPEEQNVTNVTVKGQLEGKRERRRGRGRKRGEGREKRMKEVCGMKRKGSTGADLGF